MASMEHSSCSSFCRLRWVAIKEEVVTRAREASSPTTLWVDRTTWVVGLLLLKTWVFKSKKGLAKCSLHL